MDSFSFLQQTSNDHSPQDSNDYFAQLSSFLAANPIPGSIDPKSFDQTNPYSGVGVVNPTTLASSPEEGNSPDSTTDSNHSSSSAMMSPNTIMIPQPPASKGGAVTIATTKRKTSESATAAANASNSHSGGPSAPLKDRRSASADDKFHHTHEDDGESDEKQTTGKGKRNLSTDKRKEQNRNAQRAFRERKERRTKELEDQVAALEAMATERDSENQNLKELVGRLQTENQRLAASQKANANSAMSGEQFTFSVPSAAAPPALSSSPSNLAPAFLAASQSSGPPSTFSVKAQQPLPPTPPYDTSYSNASFSSLFPSSSTSSLFGGMSVAVSPLTPPSSISNGSSVAGGSVKGAEDLFADALFTPSGEHLNPLASLASFTSGPSPQPDALSPGSVANLFADYRDTSMSGWQGYNSLDDVFGFNSTASSSSMPFGGLPSSSAPTPPFILPDASLSNTTTTSLPTSTAAFNVRNCPLDGIKEIRGAADFDLDAFCKDMSTKATCAEYAKITVAKALKEDWNFDQLLSSMGHDKVAISAYKRD